MAVRMRMCLFPPLTSVFFLRIPAVIKRAINANGGRDYVYVFETMSSPLTYISRTWTDGRWWQQKEEPMAKTIQRRRWSVNGQPDPSETPKSQVGKDAGAYLVWLQQRSHVILLNHRQIAERNTQINWWIAQDTY